MLKPYMLVACVLLVGIAGATEEDVLGTQPEVTGMPLSEGVVASADAISVPQILSYQGKLTDTLGVPVPDTTWSVRFRLYTQPSGGTHYWEETQTVRTEEGLFSALLGSVTPIPSVPDAGNLYLGMRVGSDAEMTPRLRIVSAAYAYKADSADYAASAAPTGTAGGDLGGTYPNPTVDGLQGRTVSSSAPGTNQVLKWTGSQWAPRNDSVGAGGTGTVTSVAQGTGVTCSPNPITVTGTVSLNTGYADGRYVNEAQTNAVTPGMITDTAVTMAKIAQAGAETGEVIKWTGSVWEPGPDNTGGGSGVTNVYQATGVICTPNPITSTGTVGFDSTWGHARYVNEGQVNSVTSAMIQNGQVRAADIAKPCTLSASVGSGAVLNVTNTGGGDALRASGTARFTGQIVSTVADQVDSDDAAGNRLAGTDGQDLAPLVVSSTTVCDNLNADLLDGNHASAFLSSGTDYGRSGVAANLYEGTSTLTNRYVNEGQAAGGDLSGTYPSPTLAQKGATGGQVLKWTGSQWAPGNDSAGGGSDAWTRGSPDSVLYTVNRLGIARGGADNMLYGNQRQTHVNLGVACTTGTSGQDRSDATIGGGYGNVAGVEYATVAGGQGNAAGGPGGVVGGGYGNISGDHTRDTCTVVGGGKNNSATFNFATVGGGEWNSATYAGATVCGGSRNEASGGLSVVGGGYLNTAEGSNSAILGGRENFINRMYSVIVGGEENTVYGEYATAGGGRYDTVSASYGGVLSGRNNHAGHSQYDSASVVCGGWSNLAYRTFDFVGGGWNNTADGRCATVTGGRDNHATGPYSTVSGGQADTAEGVFSGALSGYGNTAGNSNSDTGAVVCGGYSNRVTARYATIGGGFDNYATNSYATISGGHVNDCSGLYATVGGGASNAATGDYATVGGGYGHYGASYATISGGYDNSSTGWYGSIGGGTGHILSALGGTIGGGVGDSVGAYYGGVCSGLSNVAGDANSDTGAVVCGGQRNRATAKFASIGGGFSSDAGGTYSTVSGGRDNNASAQYSTVSGGAYNEAAFGGSIGGGYSHAATGNYSAVPGGYDCTADADYAFATNIRSDAGYTNSAAFNSQTATASSQTRVGTLSKASGTFTIDHPLDPAGEILNHYFIEGPEMRNIYEGSVVLDGSGRAEVNLPDYFSALNRNPHVQLTGVGTYEVYVAEKVAGNRFAIGGKPGTEVFWTVTGERKDVSAEVTRRMMPVEQPKTGRLAGKMLDDEFLAGCMGQLESEGKADGISFRTSEGRQRYEQMKRVSAEAGR